MPRIATDLLDYLCNPATALPEPTGVAEMAARLLSLHRQNGGATSNLYFGDMAGRPLFVVSVFIEALAIETSPVLSSMQARGFI